MKKILSCLLILAMMFPITAIAENDDIKVILDGERIGFDVQPVIENEHILVPIRAVAEAIGAEITWQSPVVTINKDRKKIELSIGNKEMSVIDFSYGATETRSLDTPAKIVDDRTLVPLDAVFESFDCEVEWNEENRTVNIGYMKNLEFTEKECPLLDDRLRINLPDNADDHSHGNEEESFILVNLGMKSVTVRAYELLKTSAGDIKEDAEILEYETVGDVMRQDKLEIFEIKPKAAQEPTKKYLVKLDDNYLTEVEISMMSTSNTYLIDNLSDSIIKTLKRGERALE